MEINITISRDPKVWGTGVSYQAAAAAADFLVEELFGDLVDRYPYSDVTVTSGWEEKIRAVDRHGQTMTLIIDRVGWLIERFIPVCLARVHRKRVWPVWIDAAAAAASYSCEDPEGEPGSWVTPGPHYGMAGIYRTEEDAQKEVDSWLASWRRDMEARLA